MLHPYANQHEMPSLSPEQEQEKEYVPGYKQVPDDDLRTPSKDELLPPNRRSSGTAPVRVNKVLHRKSSILACIRLVRNAILPVVAIAYLVFCYVVHYKHVPVKTRFFDDSVAHLSIIKSGVTSISILIITIGLLPLQSLLADLKSEEFFRVINNRPSGTPLSSINTISSPSFGLFDSLTVLFKRHCSPYFAMAFIAGLLLLATSTLAPAALSVTTARFDNDVIAFAVGGIGRDTVYNVTSIPPFAAFTWDSLYAKAMTVAWVENKLGLHYGFTVDDPTHYIVPPPMHLRSDLAARWLSDIVVMQPECFWSNARISSNFTQPFSSFATLLIALDQGLTVSISDTFGPTGDNQIEWRGNSLSNSTDTGIPQSGATVFSVSQCSFNCTSFSDSTFDLAGIPTLKMDYETKSFDMAFLVCSPHATVETREVHNDGRGRLTILNTTYPSQGNIHAPQIQVMFTYLFQHLSDNGGPPSATSSLGPELQADFIFGPGASNRSNPDFNVAGIFAPAPISVITDSYTKMLQSSMKVMLQGNVSKSYVPVILSTEQVIFTSSLPQVIASTVLFIVLLAVTAISHFRREIPKFTLYSVAASLDGSNMPSMFAQVQNDSDPSVNGDKLLDTFGRRVVTLTKSDANYGTLQLQ